MLRGGLLAAPSVARGRGPGIRMVGHAADACPRRRWGQPGRGRTQFDLEWDRATESVARLRQKIASHVGFWTHFQNPEVHHVLVVLPTDEREGRVQRAIWQERPHYQSQDCCTFWTTTVHRLRHWGPAGAIWLGVNLKADKPLRPEETTLRLRTPLTRFRAIRQSPGTIDDCIAKPRWWERRPAGGEAA